MAHPPSQAGNWVKVYDKASVLRVETTSTIRASSGSNVGSPTTTACASGGGARCRKGVSDLWRNYQVGIAANHRYLDALAAAPLKGEGVAALDALCRPRTNRGRRTPASTHSARPTSPCSEPRWPASTPSKGSATPTSPDVSTGAHPLTETKPTDAANASHDSSSNSAATASSPRSHALVATESPATAERVMTATISLHDDRFADNYLAA